MQTMKTVATIVPKNETGAANKAKVVSKEIATETHANAMGTCADNKSHHT